MRANVLLINQYNLWRCCMLGLVICFIYNAKLCQAADVADDEYWNAQDVNFNFVSTSVTFKDNKTLVFFTPLSLMASLQNQPQELTAYDEFHYNPNQPIADFDNAGYSKLKRRGSTMQLTLKGYALIKMEDDNTSYWSLDRIREDSIRKPIVSFSIIKHFD